MSGYSTRLEIGKRAGLHWMGELSAYAVSPGFRSTTSASRRAWTAWAASSTSPTRKPRRGPFRNYRINTGPNVSWNNGGDFVGGRIGLGMNGQLKTSGRWVQLQQTHRRLRRSSHAGRPAWSAGAAASPLGMNVKSDNRRK
jgi:hypothetical protein